MAPLYFIDLNPMCPRLLTLVFCVLITPMVFAQPERPYNLPKWDQKHFHFGYSVSGNALNFFMTAKDGALLQVTQRPGFGVNLLGAMRLHKYLELRILPGMQFGQRNLLIVDTIGPYSSGQQWATRFETVYIEMPVHIKYKAKRVNNYAPFLVAGISPRWDIYGGELENWKVVHRLIEPFDFFQELGVGADFYLQKVKISSELKFSVGFMNVFKPALELEEYFVFGNTIKEMRSGLCFLSVMVEGR